MQVQLTNDCLSVLTVHKKVVCAAGKDIALVASILALAGGKNAFKLPAQPILLNGAIAVDIFAIDGEREAIATLCMAHLHYI